MNPDPPKPSQLSHVDPSGNAWMVDVGDKAVTARKAIAIGRITMSQEAARAIQSNAISKGDALGVARIAAIQAVKATSNLIPLCHPLMLSRVAVDFETIESPPSVRCTATVEVTGKTGVEMEALTAVSVGLLTIYDMCKAIDRAMTLTDIQLFEKHGGKSGSFVRP